MRKVYKNPRELATCLKDNVEQYIDELITYEQLEEKINMIAEANKERFIKNGKVDSKIANIIGERNMTYINKIINRE